MKSLHIQLGHPASGGPTSAIKNHPS